MYNVVNKLAIGGALLLGAICWHACGSDSSEADAAMALYNSADSAYKAENYSLSQQLIDTLQAKYPRQISIQRDALHLRPKVIESITIEKIENCDSMIAVLMQEQAQLEPKFTYVNNPQLVDGYYVVKSLANNNLFSRSGVEARISPEGEFYMLSSLTAKPIKHTSISLACGGQQVNSANVAYDGDRNYRSSGTEMITFVGAECDTLGNFASINRDKTITLIFNGNGSYKQSLSKAEAVAIADTYEMSVTMTELAAAKRQRELLEQQLMLARDQIARTMKDSIPEK